MAHGLPIGIVFPLGATNPGDLGFHELAQNGEAGSGAKGNQSFVDT